MREDYTSVATWPYACSVHWRILLPILLLLSLLLLLLHLTRR